MLPRIPKIILVAGPDLHIRGGRGYPDPEIRGGGGDFKKDFSRLFGPQFGLKIMGGAGGRAPPPDPSLNRI